MRIIKKVLFPLFSIFLLYRTIELVNRLLNSTPGDFKIVELLFISFLINLFVTGIFAFPGFAYKSNKLIGDSYYNLRNTDSLHAAYNILGVKWFRKIVLVLFWARKSNKIKYFNGTRSGIENLIYQSRQSEFGHLAAFISILVLSISLLLYGYILLPAIISFLNIIVNLYPIILQRYHRIRVEKLKINYLSPL